MSSDKAVSMERRVRWKLLTGLIKSKLNSFNARFMVLTRDDITREQNTKRCCDLGHVE
jgi:hypothetical protein